MKRALSVSTLLLSCMLARPIWAEPPAPTPVTPELIAAAKAEGRIVFYSSTDILIGEMFRKGFEAKYPGIAVQVERAGSERTFQRLTQEYEAGIHTVDVVDSGDAANFLYWKRQGWLAAFVPQDVTQWPAGQRDADGFYAADRATFEVIGYNSKLVAPADAPKSFADLLDPKWRGKIVKAHPAYSGNIMTSTFELSRTLGWDYLQKLAGQRVLQVQSSTDGPKKVAMGERPLMFDGNEYYLFLMKKEGAPLEAVYPTEGTPMISGFAGVLQSAPHPNAARLFALYLFSAEAQQMQFEVGEMRSFHPQVQDKPGRLPLARIKALTADPAELEHAIETIRQKYAEYFGT